MTIPAYLDVSSRITTTMGFFITRAPVNICRRRGKLSSLLVSLQSSAADLQQTVSFRNVDDTPGCRETGWRRETVSPLTAPLPEEDGGLPREWQRGSAKGRLWRQFVIFKLTWDGQNRVCVCVCVYPSEICVRVKKLYKSERRLSNKRLKMSLNMRIKVFSLSYLSADFF